ncbi:MAG: pilus assembly protein CpaB [Solirubrobacteraceae bacterium]|nr:pilus assembly protein CpaB [Solirubrobacteraceae bacterium]
MSRRRRGLVLVGLALVLGALAAADVSRREAELDRRLAPLVPILVARTDLAPGRPIAASDVAVRELPARWAPLGAAGAPGQVAGATPAVRIPRGAYVTAGDLAAPSGAGLVRRGERAVEIVASGSPELVGPGARVDVLVTRDDAGTRLALKDVEVLAARTTRDADGAARVAATLRVTLRQAVSLTEAQSFAREIRLLARP